MSTPAICVIIPTFNRKSALLRCLEHLEVQTSKDFEVRVVDDGSTDGTQELIEQYLPTAAFPLVYKRQENSGPARARNLAIRDTESALSVLIGDDIFVSPTFVQHHVSFHRAHPDESVVALGLTNWCEDEQKVTRFMQWLSDDGLQFQYAALLAGQPPSWQHFYTSNLSFKTKYLKSNPFVESFKYAAYEDIELGLRLTREHGLKLHFLPEAVAGHLHPMDYHGSCQRMHKVGQSAYTFKQLWPEFAEYPPLSPMKQQIRRIIGQRTVLHALAFATDVLTRVWCPNPLMKRLLTLHGRIGYEFAQRQALTALPSRS
jgi:glycosyltransferase involved in cell wall biosynthesis